MECRVEGALRSLLARDLGEVSPDLLERERIGADRAAVRLDERERRLDAFGVALDRCGLTEAGDAVVGDRDVQDIGVVRRLARDRERLRKPQPHDLRLDLHGGNLLCVPARPSRSDFLAVDTQPSLNRAAEITPWNIERAKPILDQNDPRKLTPGAHRTITVDQADIDLAANYLARQYFAGGARVQLKHNSVHIGASLRAPMIPLPIYLNLESVLSENGALPKLATLRLGQMSSPWLAYWIIPRFFAYAFNDADIRSFQNVIKKVAIQG